jgi:hypothetical protein
METDPSVQVWGWPPLGSVVGGARPAESSTGDSCPPASRQRRLGRSGTSPSTDVPARKVGGVTVVDCPAVGCLIEGSWKFRARRPKDRWSATASLDGRCTRRREPTRAATRDRPRPPVEQVSPARMVASRRAVMRPRELHRCTDRAGSVIGRGPGGGWRRAVMPITDGRTRPVAGRRWSPPERSRANPGRKYRSCGRSGPGPRSRVRRGLAMATHGAVR